jgi:RHH-type proline utilization regulon transcriptional repressor/proline dehydrogenase/delta 1-pyrroline-5-carboxylate dehydrogenase
MGETLYRQLIGADKLGVRCRIYAPVGPHRTLLAYLVRRLLENGANSSFVNQIMAPEINCDALLKDPFISLQVNRGTTHPQIDLPPFLYGASRINSSGNDFSDETVLQNIARELSAFSQKKWYAASKVSGPNNRVLSYTSMEPAKQVIHNPADHRDIVGEIIEAQPSEIECALTSAVAASKTWQAVTPMQRTDILRTAANKLDEQRIELMALLIREAGKTMINADHEIREAIDFIRFYAAQITTMYHQPSLGVVACISPWNFPLAIFLGQISAALAAGNVVIAKPAEQTPLIAFYAVNVLHQAGVPSAALQLVCGAGNSVGASLIQDRRVSAVLFTGSTWTAQRINRVLAQRRVAENKSLTLIAETGGQNAMIVDASALAEQVVQDVIVSAFDSSGQRCSALRVLCLQEEIADDVIGMLRLAMHELCIGSPLLLKTDVGPVIDSAAALRLQTHINKMRAAGAVIFETPVANDIAVDLQNGSYVLPTLIEIDDLEQLDGEVFGPVLHLMRFGKIKLMNLIDAINDTGYGLTLGIHSRIESTVDSIIAHARVGNIYVNRTMIGAAVGSQPFGGEGKSGTGPKAAGPPYLAGLQQTAAVEDTEFKYVTALMPLPELPTAPLYLLWCNWLDVQCQDHCDFKSMANRLVPITPSPKTMVVELPGPTGERNCLRFNPKGRVLCVPSSTVSLLQQFDAVFATGNTALVSKEFAHFLPGTITKAILDKITIIETNQFLTTVFNLALLDVLLANHWQEKIASKTGLIVPVVTTSTNNPIPLLKLVTEQVICINTAAAGGDTQLMALAD